MRSIRARIWLHFGAALGVLALASPGMCASAPAPAAKNVPVAAKAPAATSGGKVVAQSVAKVSVTLLPPDAKADPACPVVPQAIAHKTMEPGESILLAGSGITRASVNAPEVVDVVTVSREEVILNARAEGKATVRIWDSKWKPATYYVTVAKNRPNPADVAAELTREIGVPTIIVQAGVDSVMLSGTAKSDDQIKRAEDIAQTSGLKVLNLVRVEAITAAAVIESVRAVIDNPCLTYKELPDNTVLISGAVPTTTEVLRIRDIIGAWVGDVQALPGSGTNVTSDTQVNFVGNAPITAPDAVDRSRVEAGMLDPGGVVVGEEFNTVRSVFSGRVPNGPRVVAVLNVDLSTAKQVLVTAQVLEVDRSKLKQLGINWGSLAGGEFIDQPFFVLENAIGGAVPLGNGLNAFSRLPFAAQIRALVDNSFARILSEPKLLIADGHSASILVGGELPIPIAQNSSIGVASVTVQYKPFGIQLTVRPKIGADNRISLTVTPEVSDVDRDPSSGVTTGGITIPALTVRRATTTVHVENCQPLAIGGLFSSNITKIVREIPLLSKIPVLGELFKSRNFLERQTELIIVVTPQVLEKGANAPIPVPSEK